MALDIKKIILMMRMTESNSDGEALNALRLVNGMLKAEGKTWEDVIPVRITPASPDWRQPPSKRRAGETSRYGKPASQARSKEARVFDDSIEPMLSAVGSRRHDVSTLMMLASIREFYEKNGYLTQAQYDTIERMFNSNSGPRTGRFRY